MFRTVFSTIALIFLLFAGVAARAQESPSSAASVQTLRRLMTVDQFKADLPSNAEELHLREYLELKKQGAVVVLDLRSRENFTKRHLKGSVNAPLTDLTEKTLPAVAPDKTVPVVLACDYSFMPVRQIAMTLQAYPVLKANGYAKIYRLNLWDDRDNKKMIEPGEQEKRLDFEGTDMEAAKP